MRLRSFLLLLVAALACTRPSRAPAARGTLIRRATLLDGTGAPPRIADVRIVRDRIDAVGDLTPRATDRVVDATGLVLAPGFIDTHSHYDRGVFTHRDAIAAVSQGITTAVVGQDGGSPEPSVAGFLARLDSTPAAINFATYAGHGSLREEAMRADYKRAATPAELARMEAALRLDLAAGALGLSTGLEYDPGIYSRPEEVLALARTAASSGGRYISHVRSEDRAFWPAVAELLAIGRLGMPVQLSHAKLAMRSLWGRAPALLDTLDRARAAGVRVTADVYPYTYWQSTLTVLFPDRNVDDAAAQEFALREVAAPEGLLLGRFAPEPSYVGKTLADISALRGTAPGATLAALIHEAEAWERAHPDSGGAESVIGTSMSEDDVARLLAWPHANVCTDGELAGRHPRGYGAFTRVLGRYVRERRVVSWAEAIRKMTSSAAEHVGIRERGVVAPGRYADLVLLDTARVIDRATPAAPRAVSEGIVTTWVNGVAVWDGGRATGAYPGRGVRRR
ncbi:D-aminoacylase domain protein (plasmid) [Gemmatirosa kalamazoonensis]|uniref:D-aminoacylase domain protein n=1 Tax=Gemmatirosa kalamazoonensis TaxID=861299 RepID=W0RNC1_9BACT|nr:D-aminoacylase [Gemmatirosa kalamazoonensis]AHG92236.1 D-aminoacylase domain protein [Gemmatirosa kalamazoonensis]